MRAGGAVWGERALLTCDEMRRAEALSVNRGTHSFFDLMEKAGKAVGHVVHQNYPTGRILVLCGTGNNGGDGYVAASHLRGIGRDVRVAALGTPTTPDAQTAAGRWLGETVALSVDALTGAGVIVDALFGTGLTRPVEGLVSHIIDKVSDFCLPVIAADLPSGVCGDTGRVLGAAFQAAFTVTFFRKKRGHVLMPARSYVGAVCVVDTGMHADVLDEINPLTTENDLSLWRDDLPTLKPDGHKYDRGHAVVFGGAVMTGAARLAARSAQRMGAGLVTLLSPPDAWAVYAQALESVLVMPAQKRDEILSDPKRNVLLIGPGLGLNEGSRADVLAALATRKPCVLDADALTLFAQDPEALFRALHKDCILTPHEGEFLRLFGTRIDVGLDKITRTKQAAQIAGSIVLLKGADTVIANPEGVAVVNGNAPSWLATGGAGDVLAGMILGLLAGGMEPFAAACAASSIHGSCAASFGVGLIAEDLVDRIPSFWSSFYAEMTR